MSLPLRSAFYRDSVLFNSELAQATDKMHLICSQQTRVKTDKWVPRTSAERWQGHDSDAVMGKVLPKNVRYQTMARDWLHYLVTARSTSRPPVPSPLVDLTLNLSTKQQRSGLMDSNRSALTTDWVQRPGNVNVSLLPDLEQSHPQRQHHSVRPSLWPPR